MQMTASAYNGIKKNILVYFVFLISSLLLFWPVLHKNFASDDYSVLYRIVYHHGFFTNDFFRPLSDISLYGSYLMAGFNPFYYNLFNVITHASCAFLLYRFCLTNNFSAVNGPHYFAWLAAILFLIYPFHNEAVVWAIGRGIVLSGFFGLLSLLMVFSDRSNFKKYFLAGLFYFISLCGYETVLPLPCIALLLLYFKNTSLKKLLLAAGVYSIAILANFIMRIQVSGTIWGSYGSKIFSSSTGENGIKFFKAAGRLFLPPSQSPLLSSICFVVLVVCVIAAGIYIVKRKSNQKHNFLEISSITFIACILPAMFGISTRTYEGDRVFYFSSFFLCTWIAYMASLLKNNTMRRGAVFFIASYFLFFFYQSILTWRKSGSMAGEIINEVSNIRHGGKKLYLLNLPEEYNGAQVFRNGFTDALLINHTDTSGVMVINYLTSEYALKIPGIIRPVKQQERLFIYPSSFIIGDTITARVWTYIDRNDSVHVKYKTTDMIYYWNKESFVLLPNTFDSH
jgi:protein O-mannosyl-transferase